MYLAMNRFEIARGLKKVRKLWREKVLSYCSAKTFSLLKTQTTVHALYLSYCLGISGLLIGPNPSLLKSARNQSTQGTYLGHPNRSF